MFYWEKCCYVNSILYVWIYWKAYPKAFISANLNHCFRPVCRLSISDSFDKSKCFYRFWGDFPWLWLTFSAEERRLRMPNKCVVHGCRSGYTGEPKKPGITMHSFPRYWSLPNVITLHLRHWLTNYWSPRTMWSGYFAPFQRNSKQVKLR